jgi:hypothetical protein
MSVFDRSTKTRRLVADPGTDHAVPSQAALIWGAITSPVALGPTVGVDAALVHGDQWQQVNGSMTENFTQNVTTAILQDHKHNITGNRTTQIAGNHTETVAGNLNSTIIGTTNALYLSPKNDVHASPNNRVNSASENQQEPSDKTQILGVSFEHKKSETVITDTSLGLNWLAEEFTLVKAEGTALNVEGKLLDLAAVYGISVEPKMTEVELEPLHTFLKGAEAKVAAGAVAAVPAVNAVPHPPLTGGQ